jgi:hypothetical protein
MQWDNLPFFVDVSADAMNPALLADPDDSSLLR